MINRRRLLTTSSALLAPSVFGQARAKPLRIIVGFAAGGSTDTVARQLAMRIRVDGSSAAIVENLAGAGGRMAVENVKRADSDGRTVLLTPGSMMFLYPHVYPRLAYDPVADFKPITPVVSLPYAISVGPLVPASVKTLKEFGQWCKANPRYSSYGSPGAGTTPHFLGVMLGRAWDSEYLHVAYRGGAPAIQDVLGGQIASSINVVSEAIPHTQAGKLRVLAVTSPARSKLLPDVPTIREASYPELESQEWFGLFVPRAVSDQTVQDLNTAALQAFSGPEVAETMGKLGFNVYTTTPAQFATVLKADIKRWGPVIKSTGYTAND